MSNMKEQEQNTAKLVMNAFYSVDGKNGVTAADITKYLQEKFGDVWKVSALVGKAEETLKRSAQLGFLDKRGERYISKIARGICGMRRRRCKRKRHGRRRRRRCGCSRKRRRRRRSCGCR
uniref:Uncharacterized protein n=1 Tax=Bombyx mori TaxID=7091 RepID=A0A8R2AQM3_BOMMO|nr:uncharacterized protein LOC101747011 [Bombyx mori]